MFVSAVTAVLLVSFGGVGLAKTYSVRAQSNDTWKKTHTYIGKGDSVRWKNPDIELHDLTSYAGRWDVSQQLNPGDTFKKRFKRKGTYSYRCTIHSGIVGGKCQGMCGFVHVLGR